MAFPIFPSPRLLSWECSNIGPVGVWSVLASWSSGSVRGRHGLGRQLYLPGKLLSNSG